MEESILPNEKTLATFYSSLSTLVYNTKVYGARTFLVAGPNFKRALTLCKSAHTVELVDADHALEWLMNHGLPRDCSTHLLRNSAHPS